MILQIVIICFHFFCGRNILALKRNYECDSAAITSRIPRTCEFGKPLCACSRKTKTGQKNDKRQSEKKRENKLDWRSKRRGSCKQKTLIWRTPEWWLGSNINAKGSRICVRSRVKERLERSDLLIDIPLRMSENGGCDDYVEPITIKDLDDIRTSETRTLPIDELLSIYRSSLFRKRDLLSLVKSPIRGFNQL